MDFARGDSFSAGSDMPEGSRRGRHRKPQNGDTSLSLGPVYFFVGAKKMELKLQHFQLHVFLRLDSSFK